MTLAMESVKRGIVRHGLPALLLFAFFAMASRGVVW
jgi:hypothetical protein